MKLIVGDKAPSFEGIIQNGETINNTMYVGKKIILFFYPKDNTPGCTAEACNLRDNYELLKEKQFVMIGVSPDTEKKHINFIDKHNLPFDLIADTDHTVMNSFGVWGPKKFMGREYDGVNRMTFIIDEKGFIEHIITKVKTKDHTQQILDLY